MNLEEAKRRILARESYNDVAHRLGVPSLKLYNLLANDPDIVAAKAAGKLNSSKRYSAHHFSKLPHVVDVLRNGLSQTEAAKKHGKFPSQVSRDVKKALEEQGAAPTTSTPQPTPTTPNNVELDAIANILRDAAKRLNMRPEALAYDMIHRLAD